MTRNQILRAHATVAYRNERSEVKARWSFLTVTVLMAACGPISQDLEAIDRDLERLPITRPTAEDYGVVCASAIGAMSDADFISFDELSRARAICEDQYRRNPTVAVEGLNQALIQEGHPRMAEVVARHLHDWKGNEAYQRDLLASARAP